MKIEKLIVFLYKEASFSLFQLSKLRVAIYTCEWDPLTMGYFDNFDNLNK
jgi:hypothetical protein